MPVDPFNAASLGLYAIGGSVKVYSFFKRAFTARSMANGHVKSFNREKKHRNFCEYLASMHALVQNRDDQVKSFINSSFEDVQESFTEYELELVKWAHRLGSNTPDTAETPRTEDVIEKSNTEGKGQRKRIALSGRAKYALFGDGKIAHCAVQYEKCHETLYTQFLAMGPFLGQMDLRNSPPAPGGIPALITFVALAKERVETNSKIDIIEGPNLAKYELDYGTLGHIDRNTSFTYLHDLCTKRGHLRPIEEYNGDAELKSYENCIIVHRSGGDVNESLSLARLFAEDPADKFSRGFFSEPPDGAMLRCCAVYRRGSECDLLFRTPEGCSLQTLRQLLPSSSKDSLPVPSKKDRIKLSIRLATAVLVVHSLGLVHKLILPETIIMATKSFNLSEKRKLGYPYLAAFQGTRSDIGMTHKKAEVEAYRLRGIYFHPRDQCEATHREERYTMEDDIYSLGVCLFEVGMWQSLLTFSKDANDYVYDDSFIALSDRNTWPGETFKERATAKLKVLIAETKKRIPKVLDEEFADVIISCLTVGDETNPLNETYNRFRDEETSNPVAWRYLEHVLGKLKNIHEKYAK